MRNCFMLFFLTFTVLISCNDESSTYTVGEDFLDINTKAIVTDSLSIIASTVILDSVSTTNSGRLLIGALKDEEFGNLTSQPFFNLLASDYNIDTDAVFDSIGVILYYDSYYYGDTTKIQTYKVYEIIENFDPSGDDASFYNTSSLKYSDEILGELLFTPFPTKKDSIYIPIKNSFGNNLFNKLQNNEVNNADEFYQLFKGLTISPDSNTNNILGFGKSSTVMRMFYTLKEGDIEDNNYHRDFTIQSNTRNFNKITSDRASTFLSPLVTYKDYINSTSTNNFSYVQSGSSLNMHVNIPYIKNFSYLEQKGTTINASLKFYPDIKSYKSNSVGADSLAVYVIDNNNRLIQQLTGVNGSAVYAIYNTQNDEYNSKSYYTADITYFVEQILTSSYNLNYSLLFQFPNNSSIVNKIKIYDAVNSEYKMKLTLTYLLY